MYPSPAFLQQVVAKIALQAPAEEERSLSLSILKTA
jgi:hypothetical protein